MVKFITLKKGMSFGRLRQWALVETSSHAVAGTIEVVVGLYVVGAIVAGFAQVLGETAGFGRRDAF
jgi:hypothetical protein